MFYEQLNKLCKQRGITPTYATVLLGLSKGTMSNWKKGATPNGDVVVRFAEHFQVSTDFLLRGIEAVEPAALDITEEELIHNYRKLDNRGKHKLHTIIYEELDRKSSDEETPRQIPFAASGEADITPENYAKTQAMLQNFEKRAKELNGG